MEYELTPTQLDFRAQWRAFVRETIVPYANDYDAEERLPASLMARLRRPDFLGALVSPEHGGTGLDRISFGILNEEIGYGCSSVRSLLTVHSMVCYAISRWGRKVQRDLWLPRLASGEVIGAFALSEPGAGSDGKSVETRATPTGSGYLLDGQKKWTTFGQVAGLYLIFAQCEGKVTAFLVERDRPGLEILPIQGMLGARASMLGELRLISCEIPAENRLGGLGFGLNAVATSALDIGRYSVAWGCVGAGRACLEACIDYTQTRRQFGVLLKDQPQIRHMITDMITGVDAARLLCCRAGLSQERGRPNALVETCVAKYFASTMCMKVATDAVQIHGANGCSSDYPVNRHFRDAKIMEIIEGSSQIMQNLIAEQGYQTHERRSV